MNPVKLGPESWALHAPKTRVLGSIFALGKVDSAYFRTVNKNKVFLETKYWGFRESSTINICIHMKTAHGQRYTKWGQWTIALPPLPQPPKKIFAGHCHLSKIKSQSKIKDAT